jgi:hypothetical protein
VSKISLPEKTLEHWASQYVLFRFRSKAQIWWPPFGADVDIRNLPRRPGKALYLELKTATVASGGHEVRIDLRQLAAYTAMPIGRQPFYVFPLPPWSGELEGSDGATWRNPHAAPDLAFTRSGSSWFGFWTVVLTTEQVRACMATALATLTPASGPRPTKPLVRIDPRTGSQAWYGAPKKPPVPLAWRAFWNEFLECGNRNWPQLFLLEPEHVPRSDTLSHAQAVDALLRSKSVAVELAEQAQQASARDYASSERLQGGNGARPAPEPPRLVDVVLYELGADGRYRKRALDEEVSPRRTLSGRDDHRMSTFIDVDKLVQT